MERRLKLLNKKGDTLDFMEVENFGHSPEGLGLEMDNVVYQAYSSFTNVQLNVKRNEIKLKITTGAFSDKPYETFHKILRFLNEGGLELHYDVPDVGEFIRDVSFQKITKSDAAEFHVLQEELELLANGPWYTWETIASESDPVYGAGKIYDDEYSIGTGDQLTANYENIAQEELTTAPLVPGIAVGAGSTFGGYGTTGQLREFNIGRWARFTVADATKPAGFRFNTDNTYAGLKVKKGDLYQAEYFIKNDSTADFSMNNGIVSFYNEGGTLTNMTVTDPAAPKTILVKKGQTEWQRIVGPIYKAPSDGFKPLAYAYQNPTAPVGSTGIVAGFKLSRVSLKETQTVGGDYNWNSLPEGTLIDSSVTGDNVAVNFEQFDESNMPITDLAILKEKGLTTGVFTDTFVVDKDPSLAEFGFNYKGSVVGKATPMPATGQVGWRFDSRVYAPDLPTPQGSMWSVKYLIKNTFSAPISVNASVAYHDTTGAQKNMTAISGSIEVIEIPNDGQWHEVIGQTFMAPTDGTGPIGYCYTASKPLTPASVTFDVAGFSMSQLSGDKVKMGDWQVWAQGDSFLTDIRHMDDSENILDIDPSSTKSFVRTNIPQELPLQRTLRAKFRACVTFMPEVDPTTVVSGIFGLSLYPDASLIDYSIDDPATPAYDKFFIRNNGDFILTGTPKMGATLISDPVDATDGEWHDYEVEFNIGADNNFAHSFFYKQSAGYSLEFADFTITEPGGAVQKEADGPYSVISPITTIYQIDYTRIAPLLDIHNDSMYFGTQTDSSMRITIRAKDKVIENPEWLLRDPDMTIRQQEKYNLKIEPKHYLVVSSDPFERYSRLYDEDGTWNDVSVAIDPSTQGWIRIPTGDSKLELDDELAAATQGFGGPNITVEYKKEWMVV